MAISEIQSKSILIKRPKVDSWFMSGYGMNLYRGCSHHCAYCDGQAESYRVEGVFGQDVAVKTNALELLRKELDPARRRHPFNKGFVLLGGGVGDSYQPVEQQYLLTRGTLELIAGFGHPVHLLTKSTLVLRDIDLLKQINARTRALVSFSFSSVDEKLSSIFEPGVPPPAARLEAIRQLKSAGLTCGMYLMPVIPFLTDTEEQISNSLGQAKSAGIDFVIFGGMTLKEGRQKDYYLNTLRQHFPDWLQDYTKLYPGDPWGGPINSYYQTLNRRFYKIAKQQAITVRIPVALCKPYVSENDLVCLFLEQMDYFRKLRNCKSSLGYIAYQISQMKTPLRKLADYSGFKGMQTPIEKLIREILETSECLEYQELMDYEELTNEH
jgi:DNA repair photolyase